MAASYNTGTRNSGIQATHSDGGYCITIIYQPDLSSWSSQNEACYKKERLTPSFIILKTWWFKWLAPLLQCTLISNEVTGQNA